MKARPAIVVEPLVHLKISDEAQPPQLGPGRTLLWSPSTDRFRLVGQHAVTDIRTAGVAVVVVVVATTLRDDTGLEIEHRLSLGYSGLSLRRRDHVRQSFHHPTSSARAADFVFPERHHTLCYG